MQEPLISAEQMGRLQASVRNFHEVTPFLYRGGQPGKDGYKALAEAGIKTVISFRWGKKIVKTEKEAVQSLGMTFISMPLCYWKAPDIKECEQFLQIVDAEKNWPVFVHCFHGSDRTGLLVAMFRLTRQSWKVDDAYVEMKKCGFHRFRIRHFKWHLYKFARKLLKYETLLAQSPEETAETAECGSIALEADCRADARASKISNDRN
ncbi:MAG: dual specificity protein phosphatase family protein [Candidatus Obscuribacterales bacterium]|jgi:protein tyrosine/serine phosphatase|nr:dual specificity protein phosphatase family protein [Candidatus Obscuribacterales bacterium]